MRKNFLIQSMGNDISNWQLRRIFSTTVSIIFLLEVILTFKKVKIIFDIFQNKIFLILQNQFNNMKNFYFFSLLQMWMWS